MDVINNLPKGMPPTKDDRYYDSDTLRNYVWTGAKWILVEDQPIVNEVKLNSQTSLVLYKLLTIKRPITIGDFTGYPRISEYIRVLRKNYFLDIQTIPVKFVTQFGKASEFASYKLISNPDEAWEVLKKIINAK